MKSKSLKRRNLLHRQIPLYLMVAPFLIMFFIFTVLPIAVSVCLSFFNYDMISLPKFNGFENYMRMFMYDDVFPITVKNTLIFAVIAGPIGFCLSFILAWFVNDFSPMVRTLLSFMFYAPSLVGNAYFIWQVLFSGDTYGYLNSLLLSVGFITEPVQWLKTEQYIMPIIIMVQLWQSMGISFLANISGLQNVNRELYESGSIDGIRNRWQELIYITVPSMQHMLLFSAVMQIQSSFSVSAIAIQLVGFPSIGYAGDTIVSHLTDVGTVRYELGYASAIAVILFAMMALTRIIVGKILSVASK